MINGGSQEGKKETYINFTCMYKFVNSPQFFVVVIFSILCLLLSKIHRVFLFDLFGGWGVSYVIHMFLIVCV